MTIQDILLSPRVGMEDTLVEMEKNLNGNTIGRDYTSAYHNLMEANRVLAIDSLMGTSNIIRKKFPILANNMEDLFFSIHDEVKDNLFSIGGTVPMVFYINIMDLRQYGIRENNSFITTIPSGSTITVLETTFTLLNDIIITLKNNNIITIEQVENELDIAINNVKLLQSNIYTDDNGIEWILFETKVRNILKTTKTEIISHSDTININIPLTLKYSTITAGYVNNGVYNKMNVSYSDEYLNESVPTAIVVLKDNLVEVTIPKKYVLDDIAGNVVIDVYETDGEKTLDLSRLPVNEFVLNIENENIDKYKATSINITMVVASRGILNNGVNAMTFEELKHAIINSTLGDIDLPITSNQLKRKANMYGYELKIVDDSLLGREFIASKSLPDINTTMIKSYPDIYFNNSEIDISDEHLSTFISIYEHMFTIKENTIYKKDTNGILKIISNEDYDYFNKLNKVSKIRYLKDNKLFFSPFTYVIKYEKDVTSSEVYYLKPNIDNIRILDSNSNILYRANTSKYGIIKTSTGYSVKTAPILNDVIGSTDLTKLKARLHIPVKNSNSTVYFDTEYNVTNNMFSFDIVTGELFESTYKMLNGSSILKDINISLTTEMYLYIYSTDNTIIDTSNFLYNEFGNMDEPITIINKELFNVKLGTKLDYIYNNIITLFNNRQYKRHEATVPLTYENDVYQRYDNGLIIEPKELSNGRVELNMKKIHDKGEVVKDPNGDIIYKSKAGDIIIGSDGLPIVDKINGIKRIMDVMMLEYEYMVADTETHINYLDLVMNNILAMIHTDMGELNDITMDITKIKYKTFRNIKDVNIIVNNIIYPIPYNVTPKVTLILDKNNIISDNVLIDDIKSICGKIITKHLNFEKILLSNIKKDLIDNISISIIGIKLGGIEPKDNEVIITTDDNRFSINKTLELTETNNMVVKYDINLEMEYI